MMKRGDISNLLRKMHLLYLFDKLRFFVLKYKNSAQNRAFKSNFPEFKLPSDYLIYESFQMSYDRYFFGGKNDAIWIKETIEKFSPVKDIKILDWGCGPARVVRHLPELFPNAEVFATDYNSNSIDWNRKNIENVRFNLNSLDAKLPYADGFFDFIYGISIFTHLSEEKHYEWLNELYRILKPGGILLLTLQGKCFKSILTKEENEIFDSGNIIIRGNVKEGHRTYSAFHPTEFVKKWTSKMIVLEHTESKIKNGKPIQDFWVFRK